MRWQDVIDGLDCSCSELDSIWDSSHVHVQPASILRVSARNPIGSYVLIPDQDCYVFPSQRDAIEIYPEFNFLCHGLALHLHCWRTICL